MLISQETSKALDLLYNKFFDLNSLFDNAVSYMLNVWCMPNASETIHINLAHTFPLMADKISEIKDNYDDTAITRYDGSFWLPRFEQCAKFDGVGAGRTIETSGGAPLNDDTMEHKYNYKPEDIAQITTGLDPTYSDSITFVWG